MQTAIKPGDVATKAIAQKAAKSAVSGMKPKTSSAVSTTSAQPPDSSAATVIKPGEIAALAPEAAEQKKAQKEYEEAKAEFEAAHVEIKPGEYYSKEAVEAIEDPDAKKAFTEGYTKADGTKIAAGPEAYQAWFEDKHTLLATGEYIPTEAYEELDPAIQEKLYAYGTEEFNKWVESEQTKAELREKVFEKKYVAVGAPAEGEEQQYVFRRVLEEMPEESQEKVKELGITEYNEWAEAETKRLEEEAIAAAAEANTAAAAAAAEEYQQAQTAADAAWLKYWETGDFSDMAELGYSSADVPVPRDTLNNFISAYSDATTWKNATPKVREIIEKRLEQARQAEILTATDISDMKALREKEEAGFWGEVQDVGFFPALAEKAHTGAVEVASGWKTISPVPGVWTVTIPETARQVATGAWTGLTDITLALPATIETVARPAAPIIGEKYDVKKAAIGSGAALGAAAMGMVTFIKERPGKIAAAPAQEIPYTMIAFAPQAAGGIKGAARGFTKARSAVALEGLGKLRGQLSQLDVTRIRHLPASQQRAYIRAGTSGASRVTYDTLVKAGDVVHETNIKGTPVMTVKAALSEVKSLPAGTANAALQWLKSHPDVTIHGSVADRIWGAIKDAPGDMDLIVRTGAVDVAESLKRALQKATPEELVVKEAPIMGWELVKAEGKQVWRQVEVGKKATVEVARTGEKVADVLDSSALAESSMRQPYGWVDRLPVDVGGVKLSSLSDSLTHRIVAAMKIGKKGIVEGAPERAARLGSELVEYIEQLEKRATEALGKGETKTAKSLKAAADELRQALVVQETVQPRGFGRFEAWQREVTVLPLEVTGVAAGSLVAGVRSIPGAGMVERFGRGAKAMVSPRAAPGSVFSLQADVARIPVPKGMEGVWAIKLMQELELRQMKGKIPATELQTLKETTGIKEVHYDSITHDVTLVGEGNKVVGHMTGMQRVAPLQQYHATGNIGEWQKQITEKGYVEITAGDKPFLFESPQAAPAFMTTTSAGKVYNPGIVSVIFSLDDIKSPPVEVLRYMEKTMKEADALRWKGNEAGALKLANEATQTMRDMMHQMAEEGRLDPGLYPVYKLHSRPTTPSTAGKLLGQKPGRELIIEYETVVPIGTLKLYPAAKAWYAQGVRAGESTIPMTKTTSMIGYEPQKTYVAAGEGLRKVTTFERPITPATEVPMYWLTTEKALAGGAKMPSAKQFYAAKAFDILVQMRKYAPHRIRLARRSRAQEIDTGAYLPSPIRSTYTAPQLRGARGLALGEGIPPEIYAKLTAAELVAQAEKTARARSDVVGGKIAYERALEQELRRRVGALEEEAAIGYRYPSPTAMGMEIAGKLGGEYQPEEYRPTEYTSPIMDLSLSGGSPELAEGALGTEEYGPREEEIEGEETPPETEIYPEVEAEMQIEPEAEPYPEPEAYPEPYPEPEPEPEPETAEFIEIERPEFGERIAKPVSLQASSNDPKLGAVSPKHGRYVLEGEATVTARPMGQGEFLYWTGDVPPAQRFQRTINLVMNEDKAVVAVFRGPPTKAPVYGAVTIRIPLAPIAPVIEPMRPRSIVRERRTPLRIRGPRKSRISNVPIQYRSLK